MSDTTQAYDPDTGEFIEGSIESPMSLPVSVVSAEIDVQIATSKRFPRRKDKDIAIKIMDRATLSFDIAAECLYNLKRGDKDIQGPSIRFAEIVRSCFGNIRVASRFISIDAADKTRQAVIVEAVAYDTEMNESELAQVRRSIMTSAKGGQMPRAYSADQISVTVMAAQAIARRNAILALVPKALWIDAISKVEEVVRGTAETLNARRAKMLTEFAKFGIKPADLFASMDVESEQEIGLNDMSRLAAMWTALKEGEAPESVLGVAIARHATVKNPMANTLGRQEEAGKSQGELPSSAGAGAATTSTTAAPSSSTNTASSEEAEKQKRTRRTKAQMEEARAADQAQAQAQKEPPPSDPTDPGPIPEFLRRTLPAGETVNEEVRDRAAEQAQEEREAAGQAARPAQPAQPAPKQSEFGRLMEAIRNHEGSAGGLMDWWRSERKARSELEFEEQGEITKYYNSRFSELYAAEKEEEERLAKAEKDK